MNFHRQPHDDMGTATFIDLHTSEANDINNYGELVGASQSLSGQYRAMYKAPESGKNQSWFDLGVLGSGSTAGNTSVAKSINDFGIIVGNGNIKVGSSYVNATFVVNNVGNPGSQPLLNLAEQSWVWTGSTWQRADLAGWQFTSVERINEANWIIGSGTKNGVTRSFVLSPR